MSIPISQFTPPPIFLLDSHTFVLYLWGKKKVKVIQSWPTLCNSMDYTVRVILQARILEWIAFPFSRGSSQPRNQTQVSLIVGRFFTSWAKREAQEYWSEWVAYPFSSRSSQPRNWTGSPAVQADSLLTEISGKPLVWYFVSISAF